MAGRECYHCKKWLSEKAKRTHDCWTTTEEKLTNDLSEDLKDAWERLRDTAVEFGEQRIYASHRSIMFSIKACYFFVRPTKKRLEVCFFIGRKIKHPLIKNVYQTTKVKVAHMVHITHRDQVETPLTEWLKEAYELQVPEKESPLKSKSKNPKKKLPLKTKTVKWSSLVAL